MEQEAVITDKGMKWDTTKVFLTGMVKGGAAVVVGAILGAMIANKLRSTED